MDNIFNSILSRKPKASMFNLSHSRKFSFQPGKLVPIMCQEVLPSDKWNYDVNALVRMMPMPAPVMHMVDVFSHSFFVPSRLQMEHGKFEVFITGGKNGDGKDALGNTIEIPHAMFRPITVGASNFAVQTQLAPGTLGDYLGIGYSTKTMPDYATLTPINMMPFIAFWQIWCQYFRDPNLHPDYENLYPGIFQATGNITAAIKAAMADEENPFDFWTLPNVCWEKDYFTSCLPFAQRGEPVTTPLEGNATVVYKETTTVHNWQDGTDGSNRTLSRGSILDPEDGGLLLAAGDPNGTNQRLENIEEVQVDSGGFNINSLRLAARLQEWLEKMARGGYRYIEQMWQHFHVRSSDARLQRPEYLGGGKLPVSISEVLQTSENGETPLAEMAGHGVSAGHVAGFNKFFEEHGLIITMFFLRPRTTYQEGLPRLWNRRFDKLDWAWPSFAHLGEQNVYRSEIFWECDSDPVTVGDDLQTFGYQQRYAEYKYIPSTAHGEFKTSLDFWHWGRKFNEEYPSGEPALTRTFVECHPSSRIFNVIQETDSLYAIVNNKINCVRPLPYYGEPSL